MVIVILYLTVIASVIADENVGRKLFEAGGTLNLGTQVYSQNKDESGANLIIECAPVFCYRLFPNLNIGLEWTESIQIWAGGQETMPVFTGIGGRFEFLKSFASQKLSFYTGAAVQYNFYSSKTLDMAPDTARETTNNNSGYTINPFIGIRKQIDSTIYLKIEPSFSIVSF